MRVYIYIIYIHYELYIYILYIHIMNYTLLTYIINAIFISNISYCFFEALLGSQGIVVYLFFIRGFPYPFHSITIPLSLKLTRSELCALLQISEIKLPGRKVIALLLPRRQIKTRCVVSLVVHP